MPRLFSEIRNELVRLINQNISINKISEKLNLAKSTIYYYYKKIRGRKFLLPSFEIGFTEKEGEIVGIFAGDGSQYFNNKNYKYEVNVHFGQHNYEYLLYVKKLYESFFNKKFNIVYEHKIPRRIRICSKPIFLYFKNYLAYDSKAKHSTVKLHSLAFPKKFKIGFLRGLVDTDGSILKIKSENRLRIVYTTTSFKLAKQVQNILEKYDIVSGLYKYKNPYRNEKTVYYVSLWSKYIDKYLNTVKPFKAKFMGK